MNIKKISALTLAAFLAVSLCGCNSETESSDTDNSSGNAPNSSYSVPEDATFLKGAMGDPIGLSEITSASDANFNEISPELLTADNFGNATANIAYYAVPKYPCHTSFDDTYNADESLFTDVPQESVSGDYIKVKPGDKIFGLTVTEASSTFNQNARVTGGIVGTNLALDGEVTLTGYAQIVQEDEYGVSAGDIQFIPTGKVELPIVRFDNTDENGLPNRSTGDVVFLGDIAFTNEFFGYFRIGNVNDTSADLSDIPTDGSFAKVTVTITNIRMESMIDWITQVRATIVSVSAAN